MPRLRRLSGEQVCAILAAQGFTRMRQQGSHVVMQKRTETSTITVPVPLHGELKTGTLRSIIRQSRLSRDLFETP